MSDPQSTATKRPDARSLCRCSAAAISSLPVPLSPSISTVLREAATRATVSASARVSAAKAVLEIAVKAVTFEDLEARIAVLEQQAHQR